MKPNLFLYLITLVLIAITPAEAGTIGKSSSNQTITTSIWSVIAKTSGIPAGSGPLNLVWTVNSGTAYSYFSFLNNGTLNVNQFTASVTQTQVSGSGKPNDVSFYICQNGNWDLTKNTCSGVVTLIGNASDLSFLVSNTNLTVGQELQIQAVTKPNTKNVYLTEVSTAVSRSGVRNGVIVNS